MTVFSAQMLSKGRIIPSVAIFMCFHCLYCELLVSSVCAQSPVGEQQHIGPELLGRRRDLGKAICLDFFFFTHFFLLCKWLVCKWEFLPPNVEALKTFFVSVLKHQLFPH